MQVSVICPVFNTDPALIEAAVETVLRQDGSHDVQLVVVDDASTHPSTHHYLDQLQMRGPKFKIIRSSQNNGPGQARAVGLKNADHEWIGFIDADDLWPIDKLRVANSVLAETQDAVWICGPSTTLRPDQTEQPMTPLVPSSNLNDGNSAHVELSGLSLTRTLINAMPPLGASLLRKEVISRAGGFDKRVRYGEDWLLYLHLSTLAPMQYVAAKSYILRRQQFSMMWSPNRMSVTFMRSIRIAIRDPRLKKIRKPLRWYKYANYKSLAVNNALNGQRAKGFLFACSALLTDPREIKEFLCYIKSFTRPDHEARAGYRAYSSSEQVVLSEIGKPSKAKFEP